MIDARRAQLNFGDKLIADEVDGLYEEWMVHVDQVLADEKSQTQPGTVKQRFQAER